jgi:hypothetical protein
MLEDHRINADREHFYLVPLHMREGVFGSLWYAPSEEELDAGLEALLERIESKFMLHRDTRNWYEVDCDKLPAYAHGRLAWSRHGLGALPPEPLF